MKSLNYFLIKKIVFLIKHCLLRLFKGISKNPSFHHLSPFPFSKIEGVMEFLEMPLILPASFKALVMMHSNWPFELRNSSEAHFSIALSTSGSSLSTNGFFCAILLMKGTRINNRTHVFIATQHD